MNKETNNKQQRKFKSGGSGLQKSRLLEIMVRCISFSPQGLQTPLNLTDVLASFLLIQDLNVFMYCCNTIFSFMTCSS